MENSEREGLEKRLFEVVFLLLTIEIFRVLLECVILSPLLDCCLIFHILTPVVLDRLYSHSKLLAIKHQFFSTQNKNPTGGQILFSLQKISAEKWLLRARTQENLCV